MFLKSSCHSACAVILDKCFADNSDILAIDHVCFGEFEPPWGAADFAGCDGKSALRKRNRRIKVARLLPSSDDANAHCRRLAQSPRPRQSQAKTDLALYQPIVGYVVFDRLGTAFFIQRLAVLPEYRRQGIGRQLVEEVKQHLGIARSRLFMCVHERNLEAQLFARRMRFWGVSTKRGCFASTVMKDDHDDAYWFVFPKP